MFPCSAQDIAILCRAQSRHLVAVAVQLLQDLVAFCVQDVNLPFGWTRANATDPYLFRQGSSVCLMDVCVFVCVLVVHLNLFFNFDDAVTSDAVW